MKNIYKWSSNARIRIENNKVIIENVQYGQDAVDLFPKLYYLTQQGVDFDELKQAFPDMEENRLRSWIHELQRNGFLSSAPEEIDQIFFPQMRYYEGALETEKGQPLILDEEQTEQFKESSLNRCVNNGAALKLPSVSFDEILERRRSVRVFTGEEMEADLFSRIMKTLGKRESGELGRYYPSAGGLAPVDVYVYIEKDRVEDVEAGLYYYNPAEHSLMTVVSGSCIDSSSEFPLNKETFETSAATLYFFYNADYSMPKYGSRGYFYGIVDSGIMAGLLSEQIEKCGAGSCIIGDQPFEMIQPLFGTNQNQKFLFSMCFGLIAEEKD